MTETYDAATGLKLSKVATNAMGTNTLNYFDYKDVNGIKFPSKIVSEVPQATIEFTVSKTEINKNLPDSLFEIK